MTGGVFMKITARQGVTTLMAFILAFAMIPAVPTRAKERPAPAASTSFALPSGRAGAGYTYQFNSEGGLAPLTWKVAQGQLPPGLALEPTGRLTGVPELSKLEPYSFTIEVSDSSDPPQRFQQSFALTIQAAALRILPASLKIVTSKGSDGSTPSLKQNVADNPADPPKKDGAAPAGTSSKIHPVINGVVSLSSMRALKDSDYTGPRPLTNSSYRQWLADKPKKTAAQKKHLFLLENRIANLGVHLQDPNDSNKLIATGFTDSDGEYAIAVPKDGIDPKEYVISTEGDDFTTRRTVFIGSDAQTFTVNLDLEDRPIGLLHRAIVGFEQSGASSLDSKQKFFFDLFLSTPVPFRGRINPDFGERFRLWGDARITSVPQRITTGVGDLAMNLASAAGNVPVNQIAQAFEFVAGTEFRLTGNTDLLPSFDRDTRNKYSLSVIAGFGATTPVNPRDAAEVFKIEAGAPGLPVVPPGTQYIAFVPADRDRFYRQYFAGFRIQAYYFNRFAVPRQRFPGMLDITYGINEYVTGGRARGGVFRLDGFFPLPFDGLKFINLFGTAYLRPVRSKITTPLVLEPAPGTTVPGPNVFVALAPQVNRDYYRIGAGIDFISFVQALKNKGNNK